MRLVVPLEAIRTAWLQKRCGMARIEMLQGWLLDQVVVAVGVGGHGIGAPPTPASIKASIRRCLE
jgi:hypothetical protein